MMISPESYLKEYLLENKPELLDKEKSVVDRFKLGL